MTTSQEQVEQFAKYAAAKTLHRTVTSEDWAVDFLPGSTYFATDPQGTEEEQDIVERVNAFSEHVRSASVTVRLEFPTFASTSDLSVEEEHTGIQESPFEELFDLQSNDDRINDLLEYIEEALDIPFNRRLTRRLRDLQESAHEEAPYHAPLSSESLQNLVIFLSRAPKELKYPDVTLTPQGYIYVNWHGEQHRNFAVELLPLDGATGNMARLVIFYPDTSDPTSMIRLSGTAPTSTLMNIAESHGALSWILE